MKNNHYNKTFASISPFSFLFVIGIMMLGLIFRLAVTVPPEISFTNVEILSKFGFTSNFIRNSSVFWNYLVFFLNILTILTLYWIGKEMVGSVAGICAAFFFAVYPYFVTNIYVLNSFLVISFTLYLLFMFSGVHTMSKARNFISGLFFVIAALVEPACLLLGIFPYVYFLLKQRHIAVLNSFLFFLLGVLAMLGIFIFIGLLKGTLVSILPLQGAIITFTESCKALFTHPIQYTVNTLIPYLSTNLGHPMVSGTYSYLHYVILTLAILGLLYSFVNENVRILTILLIVIFLQAIFVPVNFCAIFLMLLLLASFMIDKVVSDVF